MGSTQIYSFATDIMNEGEQGFVPDVGFHPSGDIFVVSHRDNNELRIFDSASCSMQRCYSNPDAQLDWPHGVLVTNNHILVSNKLNPPGRPSILTVYRIDDPSDKPVTVCPSPYEHLREAHSMAIHGSRLLITYCENDANAVVSFDFNDDTGEISEPVDIRDSWFDGYGEPKGVAFNEAGTKAFVTFTTKMTLKRNLAAKITKAKKRMAGKKRAKKLKRGVLLNLTGIFNAEKKKDGKQKVGSNGLVVFDVDKKGMFSKDPTQISLREDYCRLENINIEGSHCVVADPVNDTVNLYEFDGEQFPDTPIQVIQDNLTFPHDACLSPDKKLLVITNYGLEVTEDSRIRWSQFRKPRGDKVTIYKLQEAAVASH